jgi:hypothetical protein
VVSHAFNTASDYDRERMRAAAAEQEVHLEAMSKDPTYVAQYVTTEHFWTPERILDYASKIVPGLDEYYVCRVDECGYFAPNTMWVQEFKANTDECWLPLEDDPNSWNGKRVPHDFVDVAPPVSWDRGHYMCSMCLDRYEPWNPKNGYIPANKLLVCAPNGNEALARALNMDPQEVRFWYVWWADTPQAILQRRLQEIALQLVQETKEMNYEELLRHCVKKINAQAERCYFQRFEFKDQHRQTLNNINAGLTGEKKRWRYNHLVEGFLANKAPPFIHDGPNKTVVMTNDDVITYFAYSKTLCGMFPSGQ